MREVPDHAACVDAWMATLPTGASPADLVQHFDAAVQALWTAASRTLGEITVEAIVHRVLYLGTEKFPLLGGLKAEPSGVSFLGFTERAGAAPAEDLRAAFGCLLTDLLTVFGRLSAEILTPGLHAVLARVVLPAHRSGDSDKGTP